MKFRIRILLLVLSLLCGMAPGIGMAGFDEGVTAYQKDDYGTALREFSLLAMQGDARAQNRLGAMYELGKEVPQDYKEAVKWYRLAADQREAEAQTNVGFMFQAGTGVPQDYKEAVKWFRLAADQGEDEAQGALGYMYETGTGVPKDIKKALKWYHLAADNGNALAQNKLGLMYQEGMGVLKDIKKALKWFRLAADQGYDRAQANLGLMYLRGEDDKEALKWYRLAADQGYAEAQSQLGAMYATGRGVLQDHNEAVKWFRPAADQGNARAQSFLADRYANGEGVTQDYKEAVKWYRLAAEQEDFHAQLKLGEMYENGTGVPQNRIVAYALYALSSGRNSERLADSMTAAEIKVADEWFPEIEKQGSLLKALDNLSKKTFAESPHETVKQQLSPIEAPQSSSYASYGVASLWITMILIWAIAEGVGALKKKEFRERLQFAAIWSAVLTSIATVGQMKTEQNALIQLAVCLALYGTAAGVFYFVRVTLNTLWQKKETTPSPDSPSISQEAVNIPKIDTEEELMDDLEELKKRKERLLLERDVARLERSERWAAVVSRWSWLWVVPLGLLGVFLLLLGLDKIHSGGIVPIFLSAVPLAPLAAKLFMKS